MRTRLTTIVLLALALPAPAYARGHFDPTTEFEQHEWIPIHLGPLNLSITKAVVYLMIGSALTILTGLVLMRGPTLTRRGTTGELIYDVAETQVAEQGLPSKAIGRWFPYVASLMLFIFVVNLIGFIPLPLTGETYHGTGSMCAGVQLYIQQWSNSGFSTPSACIYGGATGSTCDFSDTSKTMGAFATAHSTLGTAQAIGSGLAGVASRICPLTPLKVTSLPYS